MAQEIVGFKLVLDGQEKVIGSIGEMKKLLKEANFELLQAQQNFGEYSAEAVQAAKKVATLKDTIQEAKETSDLFDPGKKFQAFSGALTAIAGGFSAVQGALGLVGAEGQNVEKALLKVQSALALSQGLSTIKDSAKDFARLKTVALDTFKGIKTAIGSLGIGALVIAVGALVAYWDDIKAAVTGVSSEQKKVLEDSQKNVKAEQEKLESLNGQDNILKLQGKSEREILKLKISQTDQVIAATEANIKQQQIIVKAQIEAEKRNKAILKGLLEFVAAPIQLLIDGVAKVASAFGAEFEFNISESIAGAVFDPKQVQDRGAETIKELEKQLTGLKNQRAGFQLSIQNIDTQAGQKQLQAEKERLDKRKKLLEERYEFEKGIEEEIKKLTDDRIKYVENREKQFKDNSQRTSELLANRIKDISANIAERNNIINELQLSKQDKEINDLAIQLNKKLELVKGNAVLENALTQQFEEQKAAIKKKYADESLAATANILGQAAALFGKQTAAGKAVAIAEATINTYLAASKALTGIVKGNPFSAGLAIAQAAIIVATGLKNVREIIKTKVPGSSAGGSVPASLSAAAAPLSPSAPIQATLTQLDQRSINQLGSATNRAYVVESDITNSQERIRRINRAARLN